ncbi:DNA-processing protein DprA [Glycomyces sp. MUSA5-2]|uniref:DNA-processing protein DprA n=1 Tax=Glycomyces sp. MUSA5-2 TaxID=2053002 RepID=UPI003008A321
MKTLKEREARMLLSGLFEPGDADLDDLVAACGASETVHRVWSGDVPERLRPGANGTTIAFEQEPAWLAAGLVGATERCRSRVLIPGDPDWPAALEDLRGLDSDHELHLRPPRCLWVRGEGDPAQALSRSVTITGSRAATEYGQHVADDLASDLAGEGWTVVAGGGFGIDRAAHQGSLARGGTTVAVLACGVDTPYPRAHAPLFDTITARGGLLVSEWPPGTSPMSGRFLSRSRLLAAASAGTVVVEATARSDARSIARYAASLGRAVMFTPGPVTSSLSTGVHQIAREDWGARLVTGAQDVLNDLARTESASAPQPRAGRDRFAALPLLQQRLVEVLPRGYIVTADRLAAAAGMPEGAAAAALEELQASGWVEQIDGRWRLSPEHPPSPEGA